MLWRGKVPIMDDIDRMLDRGVYAKNALGIDVHPVLCVVGSKLPLPRHRIGGVDIVDVQWLVTLITSSPVTLVPAEMDIVMLGASTWRTKPPPYVTARLAAASSPASAPPLAATASAAPPSHPRRSSWAANAVTTLAPPAVHRRERPWPRRTTAASKAMGVSAAIALTMSALIAFLVMRGDETSGYTAADGSSLEAMTASATALRVEVKCAGPAFDLVGHIGALSAGTVRVSATIDGTGHYLGEFSGLRRIPTVGEVPPGTATSFDVQRVDARGRGGEITHLQVVTPIDPCAGDNS
jgi:hypothetical protein